MPATSQLEWLISMTAMIVLFWSRATRDLLKSFGWGIAGTPSIRSATKLPFLAARPIASPGPTRVILVEQGDRLNYAGFSLRSLNLTISPAGADKRTFAHRQQREAEWRYLLSRRARSGRR